MTKIAGRRRINKGLTKKVTGTNKRPNRPVRDVPMNFSIMNCRSLKYKLNSLIDNFQMNKCNFISTNETWFKSHDPQLKKYLNDLEDEHDIRCIRKDRKLGRTGLAHGGVALFFDKTSCDFKKINLNALRGPERREYEILPCRGHLKGVKREVLVFSVYLPPGIQGDVLTDILESLTDAISEAKAKCNDPWICVGGDFNRYDTSSIERIIPELVRAQSDPTRGDATLDYSFTNFNSLIEKTTTCYPIESNTGRSDHQSIVYESILTRPGAFAWETSEYLKITSEGTEKCNTLIQNKDWSEVDKAKPDIDKMTEIFQDTLDEMISECFVWKRTRRRSNESPWLTDHLRKLIKKRLIIFREEGRSVRWKHIDRAIKATITTRKAAFFNKETERLKAAGRGSGWYSILNKLNEGTDNEWNIHQLEPDKEPKQIASDLAVHFSNITNQTTDPEPPRIKSLITNKPLIPQLLESTVTKRIKEYKKTS